MDIALHIPTWLLWLVGICGGSVILFLAVTGVITYLKFHNTTSRM